MKNWEVSFDNGVTGGRYKKFYTFGGCFEYAIKHINESPWVYIDNDAISDLKRLYIKRGDGKSDLIIKK
jgi:hypothetical protein